MATGGTMAIDPCKCGFELKDLPARYGVTKEDGAVLGFSCPLCASAMPVPLDALKVFVRGSGENTEYKRWKTDGAQTGAGTTLSIGQFTLRFEELGSIEPREVCYQRVPVFADEKGEPVFKPHAPVRREYFDCIDQSRIAELRADLVGGEYQVKLPLKGLQKVEVLRIPLMAHRSSKGVDEKYYRGVNLRVWPNINIREWKYHLVGLSGVGPGAEALSGDDVKVYARGATSRDFGKSLDSLQRAGESIVGAIQERPTWVAVEIVESGQAVGGGLFQVPPATAEASSEMEMGLDFGTSNTCVGVILKRGDGGDDALEPQLLPIVENEEDWNLYLIRGGAEPSIHRGPDLWPSSAGFGPHSDLFASELVFGRTKVDQMRDLPNIERWQYGIDFGIPAAGVKPMFAEGLHCLGEFKWKEMLQAAAPDFAERLESVQAHYIAAVLMNAYLRSAIGNKFAPRTVRAWYSYPMSFNENDSDALRVAAEVKAKTILSQRTGLTWIIERGLNESEAAAANFSSAKKLIEVYLDMGGGSTDIAVQFERWAGKPHETVYITSMRYAGSALLSAYNGDGKKTSCLAPEATLDILRRKVRESRHAREVLGNPALFNEHHKNVRRNRTVHFYGYIVEYVARLLAAGFLDRRFQDEKGEFLPEMKIALYFLGNGWRFNIVTSDEYKVSLASDIGKRLVELVSEENSPYAERVRDALADVEITQMAAELRGGAHEKAVVALGLLKRKPSTSNTEAISKGRKCAILGWNTRIDAKREIPWFTMYDSHIHGPPKKEEGPTSRTGTAAGGTMKIKFGAKKAEETEGPEGRYADLPPTPRLDWKDVPPRLPSELQAPFELDPNLDMTMGALKAQCLGAGSKWFERGPYEVLLEELFRKKLRTIGG